MKDCNGMYEYNGFLIRFSESYQMWDAEPDFLIKMFGNDSKVINFISDHTYDIESQKTIAKMKSTINKSIKEGLKEKLIEEFKKL